MLKHCKIGIMGGSFDPVHKAHTALAKAACQKCGLAAVLFVPAKQAPLRDVPVRSKDAERLEMLKIALEDFPFEHTIELCELRRASVSYSIDTAKFLREKYPDNRLFWIVGEDHIAKLKNWRNIDELCGIVGFLCAARGGGAAEMALAAQGGSAEAAARLDAEFARLRIPRKARLEFFDFKKMPHSSTRVRELLQKLYSLEKSPKKNARPLDDTDAELHSLLDLKVLDYIKCHRLFACDNLNNEDNKL